ncbi:MAG: hypothetical protein KAS95_07470 [Candidatus Heimdallarchaeota archaeon]|nr:hypothetical protein [Candidatus Heimdallarchaeota archaeon]
MSFRRLSPDIYKNLKKLELSAATKSANMEETVTFEMPPEEGEEIPYYWFILMLSFGQRSGYVYDREGLHIPEPENYTYSVELWKFQGSTIKTVEIKANKVDFDSAMQAFQDQQKNLRQKGFKQINH